MYVDMKELLQIKEAYFRGELTNEQYIKAVNETLNNYVEKHNAFMEQANPKELVSKGNCCKALQYVDRLNEVIQEITIRNVDLRNTLKTSIATTGIKEYLLSTQTYTESLLSAIEEVFSKDTFKISIDYSEGKDMTVATVLFITKEGQLVVDQVVKEFSPKKFKNLEDLKTWLENFKGVSR